MEYLTTEEARKYAHRSRLAAEYVPGSGARCVYCGEWNRAETGAKILKSGNKTRYHYCINCDNKFTSTETHRNIPMNLPQPL